jgi:hypothetical protein
VGWSLGYPTSILIHSFLFVFKPIVILRPQYSVPGTTVWSGAC